MLDDLFTYRLAGDRFLTVTNASNHERDLAWFREHASGFDVELRDRLARPRDARRPGPARRAGSWPALADGELPGALQDRRRSPSPARPACSSAAPATRARTASSCSSPPRTPPPSGTPWCAAGATPAGLGARDTLRLEVCFHLYGNDLMEDPRPDRGRPGLVLQGGHGLRRRGGRRAPPARPAPPRSSSPFAITGPGIARQGNPVAGGGEVTSGTMSPCLGSGSAWPTCPPARAAAGHGDRDRRPRQGPHRRGARRSRSTARRPEPWPTPATRPT